MPIDLSSLHPAFQAALRPLIVSAVSADDPKNAQEDESSPYWINSEDWAHDVSRDAELED